MIKLELLQTKNYFKKVTIRNSKAIYMIVEEVGNKYKLQNLETKDILKKLYNSRNMVKVTHLDEVGEVVERRFIGQTPIRTRKKEKRSTTKK